MHLHLNDPVFAFAFENLEPKLVAFKYILKVFEKSNTFQILIAFNYVNENCYHSCT